MNTGEKLLKALRSGDDSKVKAVLKDAAKDVTVADAVEKVGLSHRVFYDALSDEGNPSLKTVCKIIQALKI